MEVGAAFDSSNEVEPQASDIRFVSPTSNPTIPVTAKTLDWAEEDSDDSDYHMDDAVTEDDSEEESNVDISPTENDIDDEEMEQLLADQKISTQDFQNHRQQLESEIKAIRQKQSDLNLTHEETSILESLLIELSSTDTLLNSPESMDGPSEDRQ